MSGKFNNKTLLLVFLVLTVIMLITRFTKVKKSERTLNFDIVQIDTSQVNTVLLYPRTEEGIQLTFKRSGDSWSVSRDGLTVPADARSVRSMLAELSQLKSEQLVAREAERWVEYQLEDSLATRVVLKVGAQTSLDLLVGRFNYQQAQGNNSNPYGRAQLSGKTYVRLTGGNEVHAVNGFLAMSLNQPFNRWRDQTISKFNKTDLSRIIFDYPADSGYIAENTDAGWMVAGILADSVSIAGYLNKLSRKSSQEFYDGSAVNGDPDFRVTFEGDNMPPRMVSAYIQDSSHYLINSSLNPGTWFRTEGETLFKDLFPHAESLLSAEE